MRNIDKINPFKSIIQRTDFGVLTTLLADIRVSVENSIFFRGKSLMTSKVYNENGTYNLVYTIIDINGNTESFVEDAGILPTLFLSPNQENYVSVIPYHPDKELEINIPVFNRENTVLPKGNRPFVGEFIGVSNQFSIFYNVDRWQDTKPDKMLTIEFKNDVIKKKRSIKVPLPKNNKVFMENNEIHLLTIVNNVWLHRQIDELGTLKQERRIKPNLEHFWQVLKLSFTENSYVICEKNGKITIEIISPDNKCETVELADLGSEFFNTWQPEKIEKDTFVTRFNGEFGNGWLTTKNEELLEIFCSNGEKGYKNLLTNDILPIDNKKFVISSLNKTEENSYAVVFYPMHDQQTKNKELVVLNRRIK